MGRKPLKDLRVVTMMSAEETKAVDDWMFAHRMKSRGDAMRRLIQIGLVAEEGLPRLLRAALDHKNEAVIERYKLEVLTQISGLLVQIAPLAAPEQFDESMQLHKDIRSRLQTLDTNDNEQLDLLVALLRAFGPKDGSDQQPDSAPGETPETKKPSPT